MTVDGPRRVRELLAELGIDPDTVLVIRDRTLLTREERLATDDHVEIRPVISGGSTPA
jgi:sulfur carrier protein